MRDGLWVVRVDVGLRDGLWVVRVGFGVGLLFTDFLVGERVVVALDGAKVGEAVGEIVGFSGNCEMKTPESPLATSFIPDDDDAIDLSI